MSYNNKKTNRFIDQYYALRREMLAVLSAGGLLFVLLSLVSYSSTDPSFFYATSRPMAIQNWGGAAGAYLAGFLFYMLGSAVFVLFFLLSAVIIMALMGRSLTHACVRWSAAIATVPICAILLRLCGADWYAINAGGFVGAKLALLLTTYIGWPGALIFCICGFWLSLVLMLQVPLIVSLQNGLRISKERSLQLAQVAKQRLVRAFALFSLPRMQSRDTPSEPTFTTTSTVTLPGYATARSTDNFHVDVQDVRSWGDLAEDYCDLMVRTAVYDSLIIGMCTMQRLPNTIFVRNIFLDEQVEVLFEEITTTVVQPIPAPGTLQHALRAQRDIVVSYELPDLAMFAADAPSFDAKDQFEAACRERAERLEEKLHHFGVRGSVTAVRPGPVITLFEYAPEIDTKISKIMALEDDLALALKAMSIRILAPIPGRNVVGFEISNESRQSVGLAAVLHEESYVHTQQELPLILGVDIVGEPVIENLVGMPHLLVAGSTGSGKSVGLNAMLFSLLCKRLPEEMRLILIDPKRLEFAPYSDIPHLLFPIVTNPRKAAPVLKWLVREMEGRYEKMAQLGVRNLADYQMQYEALCASGSDRVNGLGPLPYIVLVIDELADLMMVAGKEVEHHIARLAQMARAAGIHMILATQRPSVDVITGLIKVNLPSRIAYRVSSKIDSKTILDGSGAEKLLGRGDMLFMNARIADLRRIHGAYVSDDEILRLTDYLRSCSPPDYLDLQEELASLEAKQSDEQEERDDLFEEIFAFVQTQEEISISQLQRKYRIGYNRSARLIEQLELEGLLAPAQGSKPRKVLSKR